ncbi:ImmA/IrrE family metallo-endopeptidase [Virgibacillus sp. Bac330]|uniref:ImmA/IrrE family metallo-endopeptidase n=1 Tax=Virgibacillus sp. Bac330 TaxID=2419841 RepID=UPI000EF46F7C|nr:ImmA/IrrE family metallo-endopeptidase [Virgibacillus sp. Bac330]
MSWIKTIVDKLVQAHGTNDPFDIASALDIHVYKKELHSEIMGFYKYIRRNKFIFINSNLDFEEQRFTCAHELGHSQLHPRLNTPFLRNKTLYSLDKIEREANTFAVEMLMHETDLLQFQNQTLTLYEAAKIYGIPQEIIHLKFF